MKKAEDKVSVEEQNEINALKERIRTIKTKGKYSFLYGNVRKKCVEIKKMNISDTEKKKALFKYFEEQMKQK